MASPNIGSTPPPPPNTLTISDGKTERAVWQDGDGNGDPSVELFEASRHSHAGHPTWKIYCGDAPQLLNGVVVEPPRFVYLDDAAAARVLAWHAYTRPHRARCWRFDFTSKGDLRPRRPNRGRPAFVPDGRMLGVPAGGVGGAAYVFSGGPRADLETLAAMRAAGLLEHRGVKLPAEIPGPANRVVHTPEIAPKTQQAAVALAASVKRSAEEDPFVDDGPRTPPMKRARVESEERPRAVLDKHYYIDLTNRLYTLNAYASDAMDKVTTIELDVKRLSETVAALREDRDRYNKFFQNLEEKVASESGPAWWELSLGLPDDELLTDMDQRELEEEDEEEAEKAAAEKATAKDVKD